MNKLLVLTGKTCSGKTEILKELTKRGVVNPIVTYTTRPMRPGEIDGITYNFITKEEFLQMVDNNEFIEYTSYNVASGEKWFYGTALSSINKPNAAIILNPNGVKSFIEKGIDMKIVYVKCSERTIKERLIARGDNEAESKRRIEADRADFEGMDNIADLCIMNENISISLAADFALMFNWEPFLMEKSA